MQANQQREIDGLVSEDLNRLYEKIKLFEKVSQKLREVQSRLSESNSNLQKREKEITSKNEEIR